MSAFDKAWTVLKDFNSDFEGTDEEQENLMDKTNQHFADKTAGWAKEAGRMKRPEMVDETTGIMDELARREWNRGDKGSDEFGDFAPDSTEMSLGVDGHPIRLGTSGGGWGFEHGADDDTEHISDDTFRMKRPEMEDRLTELNEELARREKPLIGDKFRDRHRDEGTADDGSTMWNPEPTLGNISENTDLSDKIADRVRRKS